MLPGQRHTRRHNKKFECSAAVVPPFVRAEISKNKQEKNSNGVIIASSDSCRCRGIVRGTAKRAEDRSVLRQGPMKVQDALVPGAPAGQTQAPLGDEEGQLWQYIIIAIIFVKYYICLCKCDRYYKERFFYPYIEQSRYSTMIS